MRMEIRYVAFEKGEGIERKHYAETEGGLRRILLEDINLPSRKAAFDQQRKQKPGRPSADDVYLHRSVALILFRKYLPQRRKDAKFGRER